MEEKCFFRACVPEGSRVAKFSSKNAADRGRAHAVHMRETNISLQIAFFTSAIILNDNNAMQGAQTILITHLLKKIMFSGTL